jgi:hypothetical protein
MGLIVPNALRMLGLALLLAAAWPPAPAAAQDTFRNAGDVPAATLLLPYFEVDLDDGQGINTFFSVSNSSASAAVAHIVLWSDLAVPVLTFDVYLTGYDTQAMDLRKVLEGHLPRTADNGRTRTMPSAARGLSPRTSTSRDPPGPASARTRWTWSRSSPAWWRTFARP